MCNYESKEKMRQAFFSPSKTLQKQKKWVEKSQKQCFQNQEKEDNKKIDMVKQDLDMKEYHEN